MFMGMSSTQMITNLFVAIYEEHHIIPFPSTTLQFLCHFIDYGFRLWIRGRDHEQDKLQWELFQNIINNMGINDLNISTQLSNSSFYTSLYAKPMVRHLYIPPSSCHSTPGIATGLIVGHFYQVFMLCRHERDHIEQEIYLFFNHLLDCGYSLLNLTPLFLTSEQKASVQQENND